MIRYFLNQKIRSLTKGFRRAKCFREYTDIHRIAVLFDADHLDEVMSFVETLSGEGKEVRCFSFQPNPKLQLENYPEKVEMLNRKDLTNMGFIHKDAMDRFKSFQADTLLDLTVLPDPVLQFLSLSSEAGYRVGFLKTEKTFDDLVLEYHPEQGFAFLTDQLHFYLKSLRAK
jgi:hypothetical protein